MKKSEVKKNAFRKSVHGKEIKNIIRELIKEEELAIDWLLRYGVAIVIVLEILRLALYFTK